MSPKVALIFGYGPHVGADVAKTFHAQAYQVAIVSRSVQPENSSVQDYLSIQADLSDPSVVEGIFTTVIQKLGHPSVVVYNAASAASLFNRSTPLSSEISAFHTDYNVNVLSAYIAARLAVTSFDHLNKSSGGGPPAPGTYIYTGNKLNFIVVPPLLSSGIGKAGAAHMIQYLAEEYKDEGHRLYYADERTPDGTPAYSNIDGPAHAQFYAGLVQGREKAPWLATFVKGRGYVDFEEAVVQGVGALLPPKEG